MKRHLSFKTSKRLTQLPDLKLLDGVVAPRILHAMQAASDQLTQAGIRHALAGALAVGAHGYPRATKDVDFLVGDEAFQYHGSGIVTMAPGVPIMVGDVIVDPISIAPGEEHLDDAINNARRTPGVPVLPVAALIYLKLKSPRKRDAADIIELIKQGIDLDEVVEYLQTNAPDMIDKFVELTDAATEEENDG